MPQQQLTPLEQENAVKTWRYLRLSLIVLVFGLAVAVVSEVIRKQCVQGSISAYFYTPARGFFVGALVAIGVCLVALKGNTPWEDVLLNLAGAFAPVVAFVPTPNIDKDCASITLDPNDRVLNVSNNVGALLVVGALGLVLALVLVRRTQPDRATAPSPVGWAAAAVVWFVALAMFLWAEDVFDAHAHLAAAGLMFACIFGAVISNARNTTKYGRAYSLVAVAMGVSVIACLLSLLVTWDHRVLWIEAVLITLFAVFWGIQTRELWDRGLREAGAGHAGGA